MIFLKNKPLKNHKFSQSLAAKDKAESTVAPSAPTAAPAPAPKASKFSSNF